MLGKIITFTSNGVKKEGVCISYTCDDHGRCRNLNVEVHGVVHSVYPSNYLGSKD